MKEKIQLSDHFGYKRLIKFVIPSVIMMIFTSIYGVVDGLCVSNYVGKTALAAINLIYPVLMICGGFGFMLGTGGTATVAKTMGMGDKKRANEYFSFITLITVICGVVLAAVCIIFARPLSIMLGAKGEMLDYAVKYLCIVIAALPFYMLQNSFQNFFITAEKPKIGMWVTVAAGVTNMVLDVLFIVVFGWGLEGAALATGISQIVGGGIPLWYFSVKNTSTLRFCKTKAYWRVLLHTCYNGSSELLGNVSASVVAILYNAQLLHYAGENGVAAYGAIMYVAFIFVAIFIGFVIGSAPIVSFHYGAGNTDELKSLRKKSLNIVFITGAVMVGVAVLLAVPLCKIFVGYDAELYGITLRGFLIYSLSYIIAGYNIFGSSFFTALNNGGVSAVISFLRTCVFQVGAVLILPLIFQLDGIWLSIIFAELASAAVTTAFLAAKRKRYGY